MAEKSPMEKCLTNEILLKRTRFKSQFDLVNYAIKLAGDYVKSGRPSFIDSGDIRNPALEVLGEIAIGKDRIENITIQAYENGITIEEYVEEEDDEDEE